MIDCNVCVICTKDREVGCLMDLRKTFSKMEYDFVKERTKEVINNIRRAKNMTELEQNSFIKMWSEGWCTGCNFDSTKCAEQHECEAFKTVNKALNGGDDNNEQN